MTKVMLVEDDRIMMGLLRTLFEIEGFEVISLGAGEDILESIRRNKPDIILLDVHLKDGHGKEISGFDLLGQIRQDPELKGAKILMSSGIDFRDKSAQEGADGFILKPYMPNDLINLIKQTIA
ncbi:MAG: response regulator [Chloroflexi bacterium]|nr:response regulator [Chloroflexota bacterium]MBU1662003.1 response regulator [Chloroflexota bacterium]